MKIIKIQKKIFYSQYNNHLNHHHFNNENVTPKYILQQNKEAFTQKDLDDYDEMDFWIDDKILSTKGSELFGTWRTISSYKLNI